MARRIVEQSRQLAIVCGGDGTVNEAVNGLAGQPGSAGRVAGGTANVLAKELSLPGILPAPPNASSGRNIPNRTGPRHSEKSSGETSLLPQPGRSRCGRRSCGGHPSEIKQRAGIFATGRKAFSNLTRYTFPRFRTMGGRSFDRCHACDRGTHETTMAAVQITTEADLQRPEFELIFVTTRSAWRYLAICP